MVSATPNATNPTECLDASDALTDELLSVFFDKSCLLNATSDAVPCPIEAVSQFLDITMGELKVEATVGSVLGFLALVMLLQVGGMPIPRGKIGKSMWVLFMVVMLAQWMTMGIALAMVAIGYHNLRYNFQHCMTPLSGDIALMDAMGLAVSFFQPVVLMKLMVMMTYAMALSEGAKLYKACESGGLPQMRVGVTKAAVECIESAKCCGGGAHHCRQVYWVLCWCGLLKTLGTTTVKSWNAQTGWIARKFVDMDSVAFFYYYVNPGFVVPLVFNLLCWVLTLSCLFSIIFFMPMLLAPCVLYYVLWKFFQWCLFD